MSAAALRHPVHEDIELSWHDHAGPSVAHVEGYDVIGCRTCGFRHVVPLPDAKAMEADYAQSYYAETKPTYLEDASADQAWARLSQDDRLAGIERTVPARGTLIEIGSGPGFFLDRAVERGWTAIGVEPSIQAAAFAQGRGRDIRNTTFDKAMADGLPLADAIVATNVLEHIVDPIGMLRLAHAALRPGGVLCLTVPNDFSPLQLAARDGKGHAPWWIAPPHHLNYFDFASAEALLARLGYVPVARQTTFPMEAFLLMGDDYVREPANGKPSHQRRMSFDLAFTNAGIDETRRQFYAALAAAGMGREATLIAIRS